MTKIYNNLATKTMYAEHDSMWYVFKNQVWQPVLPIPDDKHMKYLNPVTWGRLYENFRGVYRW